MASRKSSATVVDEATSVGTVAVVTGFSEAVVDSEVMATVDEVEAVV